MELTFWGVRGGMPAPGAATQRFGGNSPCIELRAASHLVIFDAGTGLRDLGRDLMARSPASGDLLAGPLLSYDFPMPLDKTWASALHVFAVH